MQYGWYDNIVILGDFNSNNSHLNEPATLVKNPEAS
jgi:hypothetical protein